MNARNSRVIAALASRRKALVDAAVVIAVTVIVVLAVVVSGTMDSVNFTLLFMGFDVDRAQMISSLLIAVLAAAVAAVISDRRVMATLAGLGAFAALFGQVFLTETRSALAATGANGSFDLGGWLLTLLTLLAAGLIASWAGAALVGVVRPELASAELVLREVIRKRRLDRLLLRQPLAVTLVLILLVVTVPVFGDLVNYTPDARMLHGGAPPAGLIPVEPSESLTSTIPSSSASASLTSSPSSSPPPSISASPSASLSSASSPPPTPSPTRDPQPWLAWRPTGSGAFTSVILTAPWTDGTATTEDIGIYTPPGYDPHGDRHYPVVYEAPFDYQLWDSSINFAVALNTMIDRGTIPAMIVVFINAWRAPIYDTECANSVDGRQWFDTFISQTVVSYMDTNYRTIARAAARAFMGFSAGGYCAAILPLLHPSVFATAIPFSGYFRAGEGDASAKLPFGGDAAALAAASPILVAASLPLVQRDGLYFIIVAKPTEAFFGPEALAFERVLANEGYEYLALSAELGHGWAQVRQDLSPALTTWAAHLVAEGVFDSSFPSPNPKLS